MYPDGQRDGQPSELQRILGLRPPQAMATMPPPAPAAAPPQPQTLPPPQTPPPPQRPQARPDDPPPFRLREPWELPDVVVEPDGDDYDDYDDELDEPGGGAGGWPLGSYESRRAALSQPARRRSRLRFAVPVLLLAAVGFGAVRLLGDHSGSRPPAPDDQRPQSPSPSGSPSDSRPSPSDGATVLASFPGYPGQGNRNGGALSVNAIGAANGQELAVGSADGYPAIWRQGPGSSWSLTGAGGDGVLTGRPGNQALTAVADGPAGWLAVGSVVSGARQHPVVVTSADGQAWQAVDDAASFDGPGLYTYGATAGRLDYVIVGERVTGNTATAATWWSAGLGAWNNGSVGGSGSGEPSGMFAVAVGRERFVAAGADGGKPAVWTSPNGQHWTVTDLALPAGATKAALREVTTSGARLVATGSAETPDGTVVFAEVSDDDGSTWQEAALPAGGNAVSAVTALAASGSGFVAAGEAGQSSAPFAVVWRSADGKTWTPAMAVPGPAGAKVRAITGLAAMGGTVRGTGLATTKAGASPVVYTAP
jgi:hypothetical protein